MKLLRREKVGRHSKQLRLARQGQPIPNPTAGFAITQAHFSGPLPPPEMLARYNDAVPGGAERILAMAENQSKHRQELERIVIDANAHTQKTAPVYGFIICMTAILGGIYLIYLGKSAQGLASIVTALVSLAAVFVIGKLRQKKELNEKSLAVPEPPKSN